MQITWTYVKFDELTLRQLYAIFQLRIEVFIVEQNCPFQDADNKDSEGYHLMGWKDNLLAAYTRLLPPGISYKEPSIGRVVTSPKARGGGLGKELMQRSIDECYRLFGKTPIKIGAQLYLKRFYELYGFRQDSDIYDEDGIDHIEMILKI
ncbi:MAG: GNAT family N-acetyltransferase [Chitinophagaceae bacterium]